MRVRLTRVDNIDLRLFEFDYDVTMMTFFLDADGKVYARYGGRDPSGPDSRQTLDGLRYTMQSVLAMHENANKEFARLNDDAPRSVRDFSGGFRRGCMHCHQVKEAYQADMRRRGKWDNELAWRYPLPENLGFEVEKDRSNVVKGVKEKSPAAAAGLQSGDLVQKLNGYPIHSFADIQYALDRAPKTGAVEITWKRGDRPMSEKLTLTEGWRRTDLTWRPSMSMLIPSAPVYGNDLTADEKKQLGLSPTQLAFRQKDSVASRARDAGVKGGDIILGIDGKKLETDVTGFLRHVQRNYLYGDRVTLNLLRDGKRLDLPLTLPR